MPCCSSLINTQFPNAEAYFGYFQASMMDISCEDS